MKILAMIGLATIGVIISTTVDYLFGKYTYSEMSTLQFRGHCGIQFFFGMLFWYCINLKTSQCTKD